MAEPCFWHPVTETSSSNGDQLSRNLHTWWKQIQFLKHFCLETPKEMANVQNDGHIFGLDKQNGACKILSYLR